ncbi:MAG: sugar ABC transporter permease [Phycisphaerales bacterium]|nr:MAG: sugar ABC transporter permease [Phycisphaerales bacterium]
MNTHQRTNWRGYAFIAPATIYLVIFSLLPIVFAGYMSLHRWHLLKPDKPFVGLANFQTLAADPFFRNAVFNSFVYAIASVPLGVVTSLAVALLVTRRLRGVGVFRTLFYIPGICSQVAISMVWIWILLPETGLINYCVGKVNGWIAGAGLADSGLIPTTTNFLQEPGWAMAALVAMSLWIGLGPRMIIFVAGLQNISEELYEAASLDGCTGAKSFWHITLPQLAPTTLFVTVTTTIAAFQLFTPVYMMTKGGPQRTTDVVLYHIYKEAWQKFELGMASAQSYVLFAMIVLIAAVQLWLMRGGLATEEAR